MAIPKLSTTLVVGFAGLVLLAAAYMAAGSLPVQDFSQYWSSAHLIRQNPYSPALVVGFQESHGVRVDPPLVLKNPPWIIPSFLLLGAFSYRVGFAIWSLLTIVILFGCTHAIWRALKPNRDDGTPLYLALLFGPAIVQLMLGQWTILVLLGAVVFLTSVERKHNLIAGASLVLMSGKPHVSLLFFLAVALWATLHKRWPILVSAAVTLLASCLIVECLNPHIWTQYLARTSQVVHETEAYPNLGGMLYLSSRRHLFGLLPQLVGGVWLGFYFRKHWREWDWWTHGTLVMACSVVSSYYSFPYDQILCLPALLVALASGNRLLLLLAFAATDMGFLIYIFNLAHGLGLGYMFLWWTGLGWLVAIVLARTRFGTPETGEQKMIP